MSQSRFSGPRSDLFRRPVFDGFPYLVSRVCPGMYHVIVLPAERTEEELVTLAERQAGANRLETYLVLGFRRGVGFGCDGGPGVPSETIPRGGAIVSDKLQPPERFPATPELLRRSARLHTFIDGLRLTGYLVPNPGWYERPGTPEELKRLTGFGPRREPLGLEACSVCGALAGVCRKKGIEGNIVTVYCVCDNHNRCAACGRALHERRLNASYYNESDGKIWQVPGFCGLSHRCPGQGEARVLNWTLNTTDCDQCAHPKDGHKLDDGCQSHFLGGGKCACDRRFGAPPVIGSPG